MSSSSRTVYITTNIRGLWVSHGFISLTILQVLQETGIKVLKMMKAKQSYIIPSVDRAIKILESLSNSRSGLSLTKISESLEIPKSTAFSILATLENGRVIQRATSGGRYKIGLKAFEIGYTYANNLDLRQSALPNIEDLARKTGETCSLAVLDNGEVVYIEKIESSHFMRTASRVGGREPAYCTALGKALLAHQSSESIEHFVAGVPMPRRTPNTIISPEQLKLHLEQVRSQVICHGQ